MARLRALDLRMDSSLRLSFVGVVYEATALLRAAPTDGGVALQPTYLANLHLLDGSLQTVLPEW